MPTMDSGVPHDAPGILRCPNEVVSSILVHCLSADLNRLSCVNKRLNELANSFLYASVHFTWTSKTTPPVVAFLRAILFRPQLAKHVQSLTLTGDGSFCISYAPSTRPPKIPWAGAEAVLGEAVRQVAKLELPQTEAWVQELKNGTMDAVIAFLLTRLPHLRSLNVIKSFTDEVELLGAMLRSSLCEQEEPPCRLPPFRRLEAVCFDFNTYYWTRRSPNTAQLLPLFYLPAAKDLDLVLDNPVRFSWPATTPDPGNLTSLKLRHVREEALRCILSATKRLKRLDWEFMYSIGYATNQDFDGDARRDSDIADLDVIVDTLRPVQGSLVDLTLRASVGDPEFDRDPLIRIRGSLAGLVEFDGIERFEVELPFLAGNIVPNNTFRISERVPRNIQTLAIREDLNVYHDGEIRDQEPYWNPVPFYVNLRSWFYKWRESTPHFRNLEIETPCDWPDEGVWLPAFQALCREERVQVNLTVHNHFEGVSTPIVIPPYNEDLA